MRALKSGMSKKLREINTKLSSFPTQDWDLTTQNTPWTCATTYFGIDNGFIIGKLAARFHTSKILCSQLLCLSWLSSQTSPRTGDCSHIFPRLSKPSFPTAPCCIFLSPALGCSLQALGTEGSGSTHRYHHKGTFMLPCTPVLFILKLLLHTDDLGSL